MKKLLSKALMLTALAGFGIGLIYSGYPYQFNGKLEVKNAEGIVETVHAKFYKRGGWLWDENVLEVTKQDGTKIKYRDYFGDNYKIDLAVITHPDGGIEHYTDKDQEDTIYQKQFEQYMQKISEQKK